jgi:hypothetical protein
MNNTEFAAVIWLDFYAESFNSFFASIKVSCEISSLFKNFSFVFMPLMLLLIL